MNSRRLVHLFFKTLIIGGAVGFITSFFVDWDKYATYLSPFDFKELIGVILFFLGYALVFTVVTQTGFFAYLFVHSFGEGFFRSFWPIVQVLLIILALFDIMYFATTDIAITFKWILVVVLLLSAYITAQWKVKLTNSKAFIPTMFLMVVVSALELSLVIRAGDIPFIILMLVPVIVVNAYLILVLHKVTAVDEAHQVRIQARRKARLEEKAKKESIKKN